MADAPQKKVETKTPSKKPEVKSLEEAEKGREIEEAAMGKEAFVEAVGMPEAVETVGEVSEVLREKGEKKGAGMGPKAKAGKYDPAQIKAELLKKMPSEKVMRSQVEKEIKKEIKYLHRKAMKMIANPGSMSYFEMSNLVKKIRELRGLLLKLVKASVEKLKTLWLRFVHGIM